MGVILYMGPTPQDGKSAYEIAVDNGYIGSEESWLSSLQGEDGKSAYQLALETGYAGTLSAWLASLRGPAGKSAYEVAVASGYIGSISEWLFSLKGPKGDPGVLPSDFGLAASWHLDSSASGSIGLFEGRYIKIGQNVLVSGVIENSTISCYFNLPFKMEKGIQAMDVGRQSMTLSSIAPLHRVTLSCAPDSKNPLLICTTPGFLTRFSFSYVTNE